MIEKNKKITEWIVISTINETINMIKTSIQLQQGQAACIYMIVFLIKQLILAQSNKETIIYHLGYTTNFPNIFFKYTIPHDMK